MASLIDIYTHIYPDRFFQEMTRVSPQLENLGKRLRTVTKLFDLDEVSFDRQITRGIFPFEFRRQSRSVPICEGVGLEVADVGHGFCFINWLKT